MTVHRPCLGDAVDFIRGITFKPEDVIPRGDRGAVVCMRTKNIQERLDERDLIAVPSSFVKRDEQFLRESDVLISSANSWNLVGKVAQVPALSYAATAGGFIAIVRAKKGAVDPQYLYRWLAADTTQATIRKCGRQTTNISNLSVPQFLALPFDPPSFQEQHRIATILGTADNLRRKRQKAFRLANEFLRAAFYDRCGDPVANTMSWPERPIFEIGNVTTGNTPSREVGAYFGNAIEWIKSDNINTPSHLLTKASEGLSELGASLGRIVPAGSTLVTCIAGSAHVIGNVAQADRRVAFNQQINAITPMPGIDPDFLYTLILFSKPRIQAASTNSMKGMVSKGAIEKVRVIWPSADAQREIATLFRKVKRLLGRMEDADPAPLVEALQHKLLA